MSQQGTLEAAPTRAIMNHLFNDWTYSVAGAATLGCNRNVPDTINIIKVTWDGTNLYIIGSFNPSCTGTLDAFEFDLNGPNLEFFGYARITNTGASVTYGQAYTIYYTETLNVPKTATVSGP